MSATAPVFDELGNYIGEMPSEREQFKQHVIQVLTADQALRFSVINHFKTLENQPVDLNE